jgi:NAD-dependent deacetylase
LETDPETIIKARSMIDCAKNIVVLTGAGISSESGVPTFRGKDGLWKNYRPEELATPEAFQAHPKIVWEWYDWRRGLISQKKSNPGHIALAELEKLRNLTLITQNVDGLHQQAGSRNVLELHGNIWRLRCTACSRSYEDRTHPLTWPPLCGYCRGLLRPDVVWFGEALKPEVIEHGLRSVIEADVMLVIGTSAQVQPAASLAWRARRLGVFVIEINIEETPLTDQADMVITGCSGQVLPFLVRQSGF